MSEVVRVFGVDTESAVLSMAMHAIPRNTGTHLQNIVYINIILRTTVMARACRIFFHT
jgi:hypothetical protein